MRGLHASSGPLVLSRFKRNTNVRSKAKIYKGEKMLGDLKSILHYYKTSKRNNKNKRNGISFKNRDYTLLIF